MKQIIFLILAILVITGGYVVFAFTEPAASPPAANVPAPINVGPIVQSKAGDLEVDNLKARGGVELGGVLRSSWLEVSGSCAWEGTRCHCRSDDSSAGNVQLVVAMTCRAGSLVDFSIKNFEISSRGKSCPAAAQWNCDPGLYVNN